MPVIELNKSNFDDNIQNNDVVVVDFWADWCGPCLAFAPVFEEVSEKFPDVVFAKVNIEQENELAQDFHVRSVPMLMIFRREFAVFADPGVQTASSLRQLVVDAQKIDIELLRKQVPDDK